MKRILLLVVLITAASSLALGQMKLKHTNHGPNDSSSAASPCPGENLSVRHVSDDAGAGQRGVSYAFTNTGSTPCTMKGYPGFNLLNKAGRRLRGVRIDKAPGSYFQQGESPQQVTLEPMKTAWFEITYSACQEPGRCPVSAKVGITAPGTKRVFILKEVLDPFDGIVNLSPVQSGLPEQ